MHREASMISTGTRKSGKSHGSRYRAVAPSSTVDESLFGHKTAGAPTGSKKAVFSSRVSNRDLKSTAAAAGTEEHVGPVMVTKRDMSRMLGQSSVLTPEEAQQLRKTREEQRQLERRVANERKARMLELEAKAKEREHATESEMLKEQESDDILAKARFLLDEEKDDVKEMNRMMLYAKCVAIRDAQLREKDAIQREEEEEARRMDIAMEIDRIKALKAYEERERRRAEEQKKGASIIVEQIREREQERIREEERRDMERQQMMAELERLQGEEMRAREAGKAKARKLMEEVMVTNRQQLEMKKLSKQEELEEDMRIAEYIRQRDLKEQALAEEKERVRKEKEMEIARLRAQQERAQDRQAEIDELRARRYQEQAERDWREKERAEQARKQRMQDDLAKAREYQMASKVQAMAEMARAERDDFERVLRVNMQKEQEDRHTSEAARSIRRRHQEELLAQIHEAEERRVKDRQEQLEEGRKVREKLARERAHLESIKERKLSELRSAGVPEKYVAELARMKI